MGNQVQSTDSSAVATFLTGISNAQKQNPNNQQPLRQSRSQPAQSLTRSLSKTQIKSNNPHNVNMTMKMNPNTMRQSLKNSRTQHPKFRVFQHQQQSPLKANMIKNSNITLKSKDSHGKIKESIVKEYNRDSIRLRESKASYNSSASSSEEQSVFSKFAKSIISPKLRLPLPSILQMENRSHSADSSYIRSSNLSRQQSVVNKMLQLPQTAYKQLIDKTKNLQNECSSLHQAIGHQKNTQIGLQHKINTTNGQLQQVRNLLSYKLKQIEGLERQRLELKNQLSQKNNQNNHFQSVIRNIEAQLLTEREANQNIRILLQNKQGELFEENTNNKRLNERNQQLIEELRKVKQEMGIQAEQMQRDNNELKGQAEQFQILKQQHLDLQRSYEKVCEERQKIEGANKFWKQQNQELNHQYDRIQKLNQSQEQQIAQQKLQVSRYKKVEEEFTHLQSEYGKARQIGQGQIQLLKSKIMALEHELSTKIETKRNEKLFERGIIYELKTENQRLWNKIITMQEKMEDNQSIPNTREHEYPPDKHNYYQSLNCISNETAGGSGTDYSNIFKTTQSYKELNQGVSEKQFSISLRNRYESFIKNLENTFAHNPELKPISEQPTLTSNQRNPNNMQMELELANKEKKYYEQKIRNLQERLYRVQQQRSNNPN